MTSSVLRGVDRGAFVVALGQRLRSRGVPVGLTALEDLVRALGLGPPPTRSALYWTARVCLVRRQSELAAFDAVFESVFADAVLEVDPVARRTPPAAAASEDLLVPVTGPSAGEDEAGSGLPWATLPPTVGGAEDSDSDVVVPLRLPSELSALADVPFEELSAHEEELLAAWLASAVRRWPTRRSRRVRPDARGHTVALRPTVERSRRTGWEPLELVRVRAVQRPRRVVMLCDVSQSMQAQATAYLHLMRALALRADAEVFAFATGLTRLTTVLAQRSSRDAVEAASASVDDRFGGTRIATNLAALLASHHGGLVRGAVVVIASDGWDADPPEQLAAAMARLRRRAHRVVWINPRAGAEGFEPQVAAMAAALPYCDRLLPAHDFRALARVVDELGADAVSPLSSRGSRARRAGSARS